MSNNSRKKNVKWALVLYDIIIFLFVALLMFVMYKGAFGFTNGVIVIHIVCSMLLIFGCRFALNIYGQIWRYGGIQCFLKLMISDGLAFVFTTIVNYCAPFPAINFDRIMAISCLNLILSLGIRMLYRYAYKSATHDTAKGRLLILLLKVFTLGSVEVSEGETDSNKINVAIIGAGKVGVNLARELMMNPMSHYKPICFIDVNDDKIGRDIGNLPVVDEREASVMSLRERSIKEVIFAVPNMELEKKKKLYEYYYSNGYRVKVYDYPIARSEENKKTLRDFDVEELLFRKPIVVTSPETSKYYAGKVVLVTGGGGSIGSEIVRQIADMKPEKLVILDIYENDAYNLQQELRMNYGDELKLSVEVVSITSEKNLDGVFSKHKPDIVINAAAHKHVPLMENNCVEAVENNVFGTLNTITMCEKYNVARYMMVSTDKAVNPTNVMGATKRMCEMIVQAYSVNGRTKYSATRFGNVLGSYGSVIPLFRRQIAAGGPVTITDKRIIRYFMTIPEASQLVLQSGSMANNGELFVLDMGQPVKILDLAINMIKLSGYLPYIDIDIVETGLRPGEKLYEELLVNKENLLKTENKLIFIEKEEPISLDVIEEKLNKLREACNSGDNDMVKTVLHEVVPTYRYPEEVNVFVN